MSLDNPVVFMAVVLTMVAMLSLILLALRWRHAALLFWATIATACIWLGIVFMVFAFAEGGASG